MTKSNPQETPGPIFKDAAYGDESVSLENKKIRLVFFRRVNGWGWGELYIRDKNEKTNKLMGILEYLAEIDIIGYHYPLRLDAESYELTHTANTQKISFNLEMQLPQAPWMRWDNFRCVEGKVEFELDNGSSWIKHSLHVKPRHRMEIRSLRGIWLKVGAGNFGAEKDDAIFPGIEWLEDKEWSSGTHNYPLKFANHVTPHPRKVAFPLMTISHNGSAVGVSWKKQKYDDIEKVQPVFASPDFIERRDESVMGLMHPSVASGLEEGKLQANSPVDFYGKGIELQSELGVCHGNSLDMVIEWIKRNGLPAPGPARYNYNDILKKIAAAYNSNLWLNEGKVEEYKDFGCYPRNEYGFLRSWHLAPCQPFLDASWEGHVDFCKRIPQAVDYYIENHDCELSKALVEKRKWCLEHSKRTLREKGCFEKMFDLFDWFNDYELKEFADKILKKQSKDGNFPFIPPAEKGVAHHYKAASAWKPLGQQGDTCVNFCATSAFLLMMVGDVLEDDKYLAAAKKALDFAMPLNRPEGGDWWETPLHAPNVMSAGYMALAYYVGWKLFKDDKYLDKAIRSIRSLLPFVTLWETKECKMLYHPKPLFGATAWHAIDWTTRHILWQTLMLFELYGDLGIDWAEIDPEIDWATFHKGITHAGLRWIADSKDKDWMSQIAFEEKLHDMLLKGKLDMIVPDNYDPVTNKYYHLCVFIAPDTLASNIIQIMKKEEENKK